MKPDQYNPKAREAFARSLIDIGAAVFKGIILLVTVVPLTAILKSALDGPGSEVSLFEIIGSLSTKTQVAIFGMMSVGLFVGHVFRKEGLRHLHEIEEKHKNQL